VLLRHGRALALPAVVRAAPALLATWFLGSETGNAIADVVFGKVNPSAHLPVSFPMTEGQQPFFYNHAGTGRPDDPNGTRHMFTARYREASNVALFPFGHGLSYTSFKLDNLQLSHRALGQNATLKIRARLANTGARTGVQVVQLYIRDDVASMVRPVRLLKAFRRVELAAGQDTVVEFSLSRDDLGFVDARGRQRVEAGTFTVWIAEDAAGGLKGTFRLLAS
jgi:beta-glucosidase